MISGKGRETKREPFRLVRGSSFVGVFITPLLTSLTARISGSDSVIYRFFMVGIVAVILAVLILLLKRKAVKRITEDQA